MIDLRAEQAEVLDAEALVGAEMAFLVHGGRNVVEDGRVEDQAFAAVGVRGRRGPHEHLPDHL